MGVINFEFDGIDLYKSLEDKIYDCKTEEFKNVIDDLSFDIPFAFSKNASFVGSEALSNPNLYDTETSVSSKKKSFGKRFLSLFSGGSSIRNMGYIKVKYDQSLLTPSVGSDRVRDSWRHTSPIRDNPRDYSEIVNQHNIKIKEDGRSICHFNPPKWFYYRGYKDMTVEELPELVERALIINGVI